MNIINFLAKGGNITDSDLIKGIQRILGVDDKQMAELWKQGINKYGSEENLAAALGQATKGLNPSASEDEIRQVLSSVFLSESEMFKCGGKMQGLLTKFGKGGSVDCGCSGMKVAKGQEGLKPLDMVNTNIIDAAPINSNWKTVTSNFLNNQPTIEYSTTGESTPANIQLSRRDALELGMRNRGYNRSQALNAYRNAKHALRNNSELRGSELRNAARNLVAGTNNINTQNVTKRIIPAAATIATPQITGPSSTISGDRIIKPAEGLTDEQLAQGVISGRFGSGKERQEALGDRYKLVQSIVNRQLRPVRPVRQVRQVRPVQQPEVSKAMYDPDNTMGTPNDWSAGWKSVAGRQPSMTEADRIAIENSKVSPFARATMKAAVAENPAVMTASGWKTDKNGNSYQTVPTAEDQELAKNLAIIGGAGSIGSVLNAAATIPTGGFSFNVVPEYTRAANGTVRASQTGQFTSGVTNAPYLSDIAAIFGFKAGGKVKDKNDVPVGDTSEQAVKLAKRTRWSQPNFGKVIKRKIGFATDLNGGQHVFENAVVNGNTAETLVSVPQPGDTLVNQTIATKYGDINKSYPQGTGNYEIVMKRLRPLFYIFKNK